MKSLRVGIISANWGAMAHLPAWRAVPGVEVVGLCTSRRETAEAAALRFFVERPYWDAAQMAADPDIDIVDCGTRPRLRHGMVLAALAHGKHVYNGIPFSADIEDARALHAAWRESGKVAVVDAFAEWVPAHRMAKALLQRGEFGAMLGGSCRFNLSLFNRPHPLFPYNWFAQGGHGVSALRNLGSHALHTLLFLFGPVAEVVCDDRRVLSEWCFPDGSVVVPETNDFANAILRFETGMILQLQVSWSASLGEGFCLDAFGSAGRFVLRSPSFPSAKDTTLQAGTLASGALVSVEPNADLHVEGLGLDVNALVPQSYPMALAMHGMVQAIRGRGTARPDFEQAFQVERVLEALRRSAAERGWVSISEVH